jgi:hypothetical protein
MSMPVLSPCMLLGVLSQASSAEQGMSLLLSLCWLHATGSLTWRLTGSSRIVGRPPEWPGAASCSW